jgi:hypothetical protein
MILVGFFIDTSLNNQPGILDHTNHWDAGWYSFIINGGYEKNPSAAAQKAKKAPLMPRPRMMAPRLLLRRRGMKAMFAPRVLMEDSLYHRFESVYI